MVYFFCRISYEDRQVAYPSMFYSSDEGVQRPAGGFFDWEKREGEVLWQGYVELRCR